MTVGRIGSRKPVATGCGVSGGKKTTGSTGRTAVSSGCGGSSSGTAWKPKGGGKKTSTRTTLFERTGRQGTRKTTSSGCGAPAKPTKPKTTSSSCGASTPSKPTRPTPVKPKPTSSGCGSSTTTPRTTRTGC